MKKTGKKIWYLLYIVLFVSLAAIPLAGMPFYRNRAEGAEQRELAEMPKLTENRRLNADFPAEFEDYFQDHFAFRSELVNTGAEILLRVFRSSAEDRVICGKDGWLFFSETLPDYSGLETVSDARLARMKTVLRLEERFCREHGAAFLFVAAPNKNSVYPEYMAGQYLRAEEPSKLDRLQALLAQGEKEEAVSFTDLKGLLLSCKQEGEPLYYSADSHWNLLGATCAYRGMMEEISRAASVSYEMYEQATFSAAEREGDLLKMVLPLDCLVREANAAYDIALTYRYEGRFRSIDDLTIRTRSEKTDGSALLMHRDSFGRALIPLLSEQFASAVYLRSTPFDLYHNIEGKTVVIHELVERNLDTLLSRAPVVPAAQLSEAEADALFGPGSGAGSAAASASDSDSARPGKVGKDGVAIVKAASNGLTQLYGYGIFPEKEESGYRVFAECDGRYYEGFPIYEEALGEEYGEEAGRCGFSFYFEEGVAADRVTVYIL